MDTAEHNLLFYQTVLGDGFYGALGLSKPKRPKPLYSSNLPGLLLTIKSLVALGLDTYFAVAGLATMGNREGSNIASKRSLYIDLDCGPKKPYTDQRTALRALVQLVRDKQIPNPSWIVNSGGGLHAYWCADEAIHPDQWQPVADALKAHAQAVGLHIDNGITTDRTRIMRAPGSMNYKIPGNPRPASIMRPLAPDTPKIYTWDELRQAFGPGNVAIRPSPVSVALGRVSSVFSAKEADNADWDGWADPVRTRAGYRLDNLQHHCPAIASIAAIRGNGIPEPLWFKALSLAAYCEDGDEWAFGQLSDGDPRYTVPETQQKYERAKHEAMKQGGNYGPPTCNSISSATDICSTCPKFADWSGKAGYPWHAAAIPATVSDGGGLALPVDWLPPGFRRKPSGHIVELTQEETTGSDGQPQVYTGEKAFTTDKLRDFQLVVREEGANKTLIPFLKMRSESNPNPYVTVNIGRMSSGSSHTLESIMNDAGLLIKMGGHDSMRRLTLELFEAIELNRERQNLTYSDAVSDTRMGFNGTWDTFYLAGNIYKKGHTVPARAAIPLDIPSPNAKMLTTALAPRGTAALSASGLRKFLAGSPTLLHLPVAASLASILLEVVDVAGFLLHLYSMETGTGKSTALRAAASLWGDPTRLMPGSNSSMLGWQMQMSMLSPLPAILDEMRFHSFSSNKKPMPGAFTPTDIKCLTEGSTGTKLKGDRTMHTPLDWRCFTLSASNDPLSTVLDSSDASAQATSARTLELDVGKCRIPLTLDTELNHSLIQNTGHIGPAFAQLILDQYPPAKIKILARNMETLITKQMRLPAVPSAMRFQIPSLSLLLVAAYIAKKHNILPFDVTAMLKAGVGALVGFNAAEAAAEKDGSRNKENLYETLVAFATSRPRLQIITMTGYVAVIPDHTTEAAACHFNLDTNELLFRVATLRDAKERNLSFSPSTRWNTVGDMPVPPGVKMEYRRDDFGAGTSYMTPGIRCVAITIPPKLAAMMQKQLAAKGTLRTV